MARSIGRTLAARTLGLAALGLAAAPALGQAATSASGAPASGNRLDMLVTALVDGVPCAGGDPREMLDERARKSGASAADIGAALAIVSSSSDVCAPVRVAASAASAELVERQIAAIEPDPTLDDAAATSAADRIAAAALDAEARAASTKFSLGPPPRNLTRGRNTGL